MKLSLLTRKTCRYTKILCLAGMIALPFHTVEAVMMFQITNVSTNLIKSLTLQGLF